MIIKTVSDGVLYKYTDTAQNYLGNEYVRIASRLTHIGTSEKLERTSDISQAHIGLILSYSIRQEIKDITVKVPVTITTTVDIQINGEDKVSTEELK